MTERPKRSASRAVAIVAASALLGVLTLAGLLGWKWYRYVTAGTSPYDEIGIDVNVRLPAPVRAWGCARVMERFPRAVPPYGCRDGQT